MAEKVVIMVEGKDDEHVVKQLYGGYPNVLPFRLKDMESIEKLVEALPVEIDASELERLGVIVDADGNVGNRWMQLSNIFREAGYQSIPPQPDKAGTIIKEAGHPVIGVWVMPDNSLPGKLEDFLSLLIPSNDLLWPKAQQDVSAIPQVLRKFSVPDTIKAQMHTWLAWQEEPGRPFGIAIRATFLDANAPHAQDFMSWLNRLLTA